MQVFEYGQAEMDHLRRQDPLLGAVIDRMGRLERGVDTDRFHTLVSSIVSQQISGRAAETVLERLTARFTGLDPASLAAAPAEELRGCGLSLRKADYIRGLADEVVSGRLDLGALTDLPDDEIVRRLVLLHGVGVWTAEMFLLFSMQRPDVVSWGDFGIRRGMSLLYGFDKMTKEDFERFRRAYTPFGSVASLYLWAVSGER